MGELTQQRQLLVKNNHLIKLAKHLSLADFVLRNLKVEFTSGSIDHILSNCVEGVIGAVYFDGGLEEADKMFARLAFPEKARNDTSIRRQNFQSKDTSA